MLHGLMAPPAMEVFKNRLNMCFLAIVEVEFVLSLGEE